MGGTKGAKTEPRRLHQLLVRDADGSAIDWKLQARLQVGEKLPPLNSEGNGSEALSRYLRRRAVWLSMREDAKRQGEQLTPYSFRHRYAKGLRAANIPCQHQRGNRSHYRAALVELRAVQAKCEGRRCTRQAGYAANRLCTNENKRVNWQHQFQHHSRSISFPMLCRRSLELFGKSPYLC